MITPFLYWWFFGWFEFIIVGYISTIYFCDKVKGTIYRSKYK